MTKLLLVEDDLLLQRTLTLHLRKKNYIVEAIDSGREALDRLRQEQYDAVILDWGLTDITGIEVCQEYRSNGGNTPILMLTGKNQTADKATGLDSGADDYLTKPFETVELEARIRALLRRSPISKALVLKFGNTALDTTSGTITIDGKPCEFFPKEFTLLEFFLKQPQHVFSASILMDRVWSTEAGVTEDTVRAYIAKLRSKLRSAGSTATISTRKGFGYFLELSESALGTKQ